MVEMPCSYYSYSNSSIIPSFIHLQLPHLWLQASPASSDLHSLASSRINPFIGSPASPVLSCPGLRPLWASSVLGLCPSWALCGLCSPPSFSVQFPVYVRHRGKGASIKWVGENCLQWEIKYEYYLTFIFSPGPPPPPPPSLWMCRICASISWEVSMANMTCILSHCWSSTLHLKTQNIVKMQVWEYFYQTWWKTWTHLTIASMYQPAGMNHSN